MSTMEAPLRANDLHVILYLFSNLCISLRCYIKVSYIVISIFLSPGIYSPLTDYLHDYMQQTGTTLENNLYDYHVVSISVD